VESASTKDLQGLLQEQPSAVDQYLVFALITDTSWMSVCQLS